jgi:hypothetical protein
MNQSKSLLHVDLEDIRKIPPEESFVPPWLFKHRDLTNKLESASTVDQKRLVNKLNYIHFIKKYLFISFVHPKYEERILIKAYPEPCLGDEITCRWMRGDASNLNLENYQFQQLIIADGQSIILVPGIIKKMDSFGLTIQLPDTSYDLCQRKTNRFICRDIEAEIIQNGVMVKGILLDFSPLAFCIRILPEASSPFIWFNVEVPTIVHLRNKKEILFAGLCRCIRQMNDIMGREIVFAPLEDTINRFKKVEFRNPRRSLTPPPTISFCHPFSNNKITLSINEISGSGFSVFENTGEGTLMPGMIIPELTINYAGTTELKCKSQVIYRQQHLDKKKTRCGLAILDMDLKSYSGLINIINHTEDYHIYISNKINMDSLWKLFFDTGFFYPEKYNNMNLYCENIKNTYRKLYLDNPNIARHFTYEVNGEIYSHIAMMRTYESTWMFHHFVSKPIGNKLTGFLVLKQAIQYLNSAHRYPSANMDYVMAYFQPSNKVANHLFGKFAIKLNNPQECSIDIFSYIMFSKKSESFRLPPGWSLQECSKVDLWKLQLFYNSNSGGLLINTLSSRSKSLNGESLENIYRKLGFIRKWNIYSLSYHSIPCAFIITNQSDHGLNLSGLLNSIKIIITNPKSLPWDILSIAISQLAKIYNADKIPLLIYPDKYLETQSISPERKYQLWILNPSRSGDDYLDYVGRKFRIKLS